MAKIRKFKGLILAGLLLCAFANVSQAQSWYEETPRTFYGGVIGGANFTQVDGDRFAGYHKVGMNVGAIVYAQLGNKVAASIEILYSQKGAKSHLVQRSAGAGSYDVQKYRINLNYAEVPIMINYFDKRKSNFGAGFSYSQLVSSSETVVANPPLPSTVNLDEEYPFRKFDVNFIVGGNLKLYKGLFLNARFQYSLLPVRKTTYPGLGRAEQYNNMWTLRLMYLFNE